MKAPLLVACPCCGPGVVPSDFGFDILHRDVAVIQLSGVLLVSEQRNRVRRGFGPFGCTPPEQTS